MSSKIPCLIRPTNLKKPTFSNQVKSSNSNSSDSKSTLVPAEYLKIENKENKLLTGKLNSQSSINFRVPRVAYLSDKTQSKNSVTGNRNKSNYFSKNEPSNHISKFNFKPQSIPIQNSGISRQNIKKTKINDVCKSLSIRQKNLIKERELRIENTQLRLQDVDSKYNQELLLSKLIESELKLQLEYLDENNCIYLEEINTIDEFERELKHEVVTIVDQLKKLESNLFNFKNLNDLRSLNNDLKLQNLDIEQTIKLILKEISECENSIKFYELEGDDGEIIVKNLRVPFNKSIEYVLNLEKMLQNDKLIINQLQFRLHKIKKNPKFICRTYSSEIPQLSKVHISIATSGKQITIEDNIENIGNSYQLTSQKNQDTRNVGLKLKVDTTKFQFRIGKEIFSFDKIIEFDDTKRPSTLLLTDLSIIDRHISNIIEEIEEPSLQSGYQPKIHKANNIIRRQSLLYSKIDSEPKNKYPLSVDSIDNIYEQSKYHLVDINEQKEVEIDVLLLINDFFNNIKLAFGEKSNSHEKLKNSSSFEISPIFITNIGSNSSASRQTFWGINNSRLVSVYDGISEQNTGKWTEDYIKKIPGILHSVIYQIYQNFNHSSLFNWRLSADILIQKSNNYESTECKFNQVDLKTQKALNTEKLLIFDGGLSGYISSEQSIYESFNSDNNFKSNDDDYHSELFLCDDSIYKSRTITSSEFKCSEEFISQIYKEVQISNPNFLDSINAYFLSERELNNSTKETPSCHLILILKIEATASNSSISSSIVLADFFIDENGAADRNIVDYLSIVKGSSVNNQFLDIFSQLKRSNQTEPLIYTLIHSTA